ncbi:MAG TPA: hypothetical protein VHV08_00490, partial [Pirellulales bacterium]|nr:hypothetical protein [Pirellulales bacterium]
MAAAQAPPPANRPQLQLAQNRPGNAARPVRKPAPDKSSEDESALDGVFLPPDRGSRRRLATAEEMLGEKRYGEAVRLLGSLLESSEDYFFKPRADEPVYRSLKAEADRLIGSLVKDGRESYELQFGTKARQQLKQAAASGNVVQLAEVSRQFFYTDAGQEATLLLGRHYLDQNRPLAAVMCFERLSTGRSEASRFEPGLSLWLATAWVRAGKPDKAKEVLTHIKHAHPGAEVIVAGKPVKLFSSDSQALAWLRETLGNQQPARGAGTEAWALYRGDESRNATSDGGRPLLNLRWRQRTTDDRSVEKFVTKLEQDHLSQEAVALPSFHPLAVGDAVLMRTAFALEAVDFATGKLIWRYPSSDDAFEQFLKAGSASPSAQNVQLFSGLTQRMWDDAIYGTLSSDGTS